MKQQDIETVGLEGLKCLPAAGPIGVINPAQTDGFAVFFDDNAVQRQFDKAGIFKKREVFGKPVVHIAADGEFAEGCLHRQQGLLEARQGGRMVEGIAGKHDKVGLETVDFLRQAGFEPGFFVAVKV